MGPGNRPLDLDWLEDFLALAESGNFSRAAKARAIAQPAFSRHIRSLEEWVGVDLFDRSAHPTTLTAAGQRFRPLLEDVLAGLQHARTQARAAHDLDAASLSFAATHVLSLTFFPRWLAGVEARLSMGPIQTISDSSYACEDLMLQRRVQFVLCHGHAGAPGRLDEAQYPVRRLSEDVLVPVSSADASGGPLHALGTQKQPAVLAYSEASGLGRIMRAMQDGEFGKHFAASLPVVFTAHHAALLRTMALEGRGLAWLPMSLVADDLRSGALVDAGKDGKGVEGKGVEGKGAEGKGAEGGWRVPIDIRLYRQQAQMAPVAEALWALLDDGGAGPAKG